MSHTYVVKAVEQTTAAWNKAMDLAHDGKYGAWPLWLEAMFRRGLVLHRMDPMTFGKFHVAFKLEGIWMEVRLLENGEFVLDPYCSSMAEVAG
jgi:hypothetical protein